jgi:hypothetical protein
VKEAQYEIHTIWENEASHHAKVMLLGYGMISNKGTSKEDEARSWATKDQLHEGESAPASLVDFEESEASQKEDRMVEALILHGSSIIHKSLTRLMRKLHLDGELEAP